MGPCSSPHCEIQGIPEEGAGYFKFYFLEAFPFLLLQRYSQSTDTVSQEASVYFSH